MADKEQTTAEVLRVARELFLSEGLLAVNMERIAEVSGMTRRNLYRHYPSRESLAYAVTAQLLADWNRQQRSIFDSLSGTGMRRFSDFCEALVASLDKQRPMLRFLGEFDIVFQDSLAFNPSPEMKKDFDSVLDRSEDLLEEILKAGMKDGSIRKDLKLKVLVPTITTTLWTLAQRIALRDRMIKEEFDIDGLSMVHQYLNILTEDLEAK